MLQVARQKIINKRIQNIYIKCTDATNIKLKSDSMDYIILGLALHEMTPLLQQKILLEAHRLLKQNGTLIVLEWEPESTLVKRIMFSPLLLLEQLLNPSFYQFYKTDKIRYFNNHNFHMIKKYKCNYSAIYCLNKQ